MIRLNYFDDHAPFLDTKGVVKLYNILANIFYELKIFLFIPIWSCFIPIYNIKQFLIHDDIYYTYTHYD